MSETYRAHVVVEGDKLEAVVMCPFKKAEHCVNCSEVRESFPSQVQDSAAEIATLQSECEALRKALVIALDDMESQMHMSHCPKDLGVLPPRCYEPCNCGREEIIKPVREALTPSLDIKEGENQ